MIVIALLSLLLFLPRQVTALPKETHATYSSQVVIAITSPETPQSPVTSSCTKEIQRYSWNTTVALNVMYAESGGNPSIVNHNLKTGDHSVGCMQINILNELAANRPSEEELKDPEINVRFAYNLWRTEKWRPWGACRKVRCY